VFPGKLCERRAFSSSLYEKQAFVPICMRWNAGPLAWQGTWPIHPLLHYTMKGSFLRQLTQHAGWKRVLSFCRQLHMCKQPVCSLATQQRKYKIKLWHKIPLACICAVYIFIIKKPPSLFILWCVLFALSQVILIRPKAVLVRSSGEI